VVLACFERTDAGLSRIDLKKVKVIGTLSEPHHRISVPGEAQTMQRDVDDHFCEAGERVKNS
jgi:hypothetical protein